MNKSFRVICDVDCTLYSYGEIVLSNLNNIFELAKASIGIATRNSDHSAVQRVWSKYQSEIEKRIQNILSLEKCDVVFYSAFPSEPYKEKSFKSCNAKFISSYPEKKLEAANKYFQDINIDLVIGDRISDYFLAKSRKAMILFLPISNFGQWKLGPSYTDYLIQNIQNKLKVYEV